MYIPALITHVQITEEPYVLAEQCKSKFKDTFTKASEVFLSQIFNVYPASQNDSFILSTSIGNTENIMKLINEYRNNKFVSAQLFPEATMSSASVNINRLFGLQGGNMSINPNLALNDAILLGLLDSAYNLRTTHLVYGEVHEFDRHLNIPSYVIYIKIMPSNNGSCIHLSENQNDSEREYDNFSNKLKSLMSDTLYQCIKSMNLRGEVARVYFKKQLAYT